MCISLLCCYCCCCCYCCYCSLVMQDSLTITLVTSNILSVPAALNFTYFCIFTFLSPSTGDPVSKRAMENVGDQSFMCFSPVLTEIPAIPAGTGKCSNGWRMVEAEGTERTGPVQCVSPEAIVTSTQCDVDPVCVP